MATAKNVEVIRSVISLIFEIWSYFLSICFYCLLFIYVRYLLTYASEMLSCLGSEMSIWIAKVYCLNKWSEWMANWVSHVADDLRRNMWAAKFEYEASLHCRRQGVMYPLKLKFSRKLGIIWVWLINLNL